MAVVAVCSHNCTTTDLGMSRVECTCGWIMGGFRSAQEADDAGHLHLASEGQDVFIVLLHPDGQGASWPEVRIERLVYPAAS